jgi:ATP-binding cassette subfamily F protein 3
MPETDESATRFVLDGDTRLAELNAQLAAAEASGDGMEIAQAYVDLADAGAHDAESRAQALILGLGFKVSELDHPVNSFSGGWRMRLQLARALMAPAICCCWTNPPTTWTWMPWSGWRPGSSAIAAR